MSNVNIEESNGKLTIDVLKDYWSRPQDSEGKPDWSHIFKFYHEDIHFKDSVQELQGYQKFTEMSSRLTRRCKRLEMKLLNVAEFEKGFYFEWEMTMKFKIYPASTIYGATRLLLAEDGRIIDQRDYYDIWGDIFDNIPGFRRFYRWRMRRRMG
ncbi:MAG: nuclear transport factor 2 family protein [Spirochaetales bacterium]|nr:nuclear transport factor 2 family protein [Spirochaetales bacterium]